MKTNETGKLIFFDIDGTLVTEGKDRYIPESTAETLKALRKNGHICIINTGRPYASLDSIIMSIDVDGYICGCGTYIRLGSDILMSHHIDNSLCLKIINALDRYGMEWLLEGEKRLYYSDREYKSRLKDDIKAIKSGLPDNIQLLDYDRLNEISFDKFCFSASESSDLKGFCSEFSDELSFIDRGNNFYETVPKGFSKAEGMKFLENYLGIDHNNTFAVGDSSNDIPMLEYAKTGILMENADKSLYKYAGYVTESIENDGIMNAFRHFGLI